MEDIHGYLLFSNNINFTCVNDIPYILGFTLGLRRFGGMTSDLAGVTHNRDAPRDNRREFPLDDRPLNDLTYLSAIAETSDFSMTSRLGA
jgi:hypothetical protein